jgi:hypothetical protein
MCKFLVLACRRCLNTFCWVDSLCLVRSKGVIYRFRWGLVLYILDRLLRLYRLDSSIFLYESLGEGEQEEEKYW